MERRRIYLDHNASAPLLAEAREALCRALELPGNPSSVHREGRAARALVEEARRSVLRLAGLPQGELVFTSGASEAAATLLTPHWLVEGEAVTLRRLAVVETDHPALREGGAFAPEQTVRLPVCRSGTVDLDALRQFAQGEEPKLLALTLANSETGVLQPIDAIRAIVAGTPTRLVLDAVQAAGRGALEPDGLDAVILSGHKLGAAKGVGALVLARGDTRPFPLIRGGGQERGRRAGTEAVPLIAAFGAAADIASRRLSQGGTAALLEMRARLESMAGELPQVCVVGGEAPRLPNTVALHCLALPAETAQMALDLAGYAVSAGSACSSGKVGRSHVLEAMERAGASIDSKVGAIRVSFGYETRQDDLDGFAADYRRLVERAVRKPSDMAA